MCQSSSVNPNVENNNNNELLTVIKETETRNPSHANSTDNLYRKSSNQNLGTIITESSNVSLQLTQTPIGRDSSILSYQLKPSTNSPTHHISCICNCSNSSKSQSLNQTPIFQSKFSSKKLRFSAKKASNSLENYSKSKLFSLFTEPVDESHIINKDSNDDKLTHENNEPISDKNETTNFCCSCKKSSSLQHDYLDVIIKKNFGEIIQLAKHTIKQGEMRLREMDRREIIQNEWSDIAMILDRLLCLFFSFSTIITCLIIFLNSPYTLSPW